MRTRTGAIALLAAAAACAPAAAQAKSLAPPTVKVNVRVEGKHATLFEGDVKTTVHRVDAHDGTGPHKCDGTNNGQNTTAGPTLLGAFDDALRMNGIAWRGQYFSDFDDFSIDKVGPDAADTKNNRYWGQSLNFKDTEKGGCQIKVHRGDQVLIAFNSFGRPHLELLGPKHARTNKPVRLTVLDGQTGKPYQGAHLAAKQTDAQGHVRVTFRHDRTYHLKAHAKGTVRSNSLTIRVHEG